MSLERGTLLDNILRMKEARKGMWESIRQRLATLDPPIDADATELGPILDEIETRLAEYIAPGSDGRSTRLFVSQLTREHLRKTIAFFLTMGRGEEAVPFQQAGSGTLNTLLLALLTFIADLKKDNVIFAMEEPEIALPPHTQRRIANYLLEETSQCFVTSHSPYVIERFEPDGILKLNRDEHGTLSGTAIKLPAGMKAKNYSPGRRRSGSIIIEQDLRTPAQTPLTTTRRIKGKIADKPDPAERARFRRLLNRTYGKVRAYHEALEGLAAAAPHLARRHLGEQIILMVVEDELTSGAREPSNQSLDPLMHKNL